MYILYTARVSLVDVGKKKLVTDDDNQMRSLGPPIRHILWGY
jgi:hypothetical protein